VIGVNRFQPQTYEPLQVRRVDNSAVRAEQAESLRRVRGERDPVRHAATLGALTAAARTGHGNLLALAIDAARAKATVGEVSAALETVFGRYEATVHRVSGVYGTEATGKDMTEPIRPLIQRFEQVEGRRPRILVAKLGQDGHDRGQKVIACALADLGFDVDVGPLFCTPAETARQAVENDVHIVGVSSLAAGHLTLIPALRAELAKLGRDDMMIVAGGVIPPQDHAALYEAGAAAIFGPGTVLSDAANELLQNLCGRLGISLPSAAQELRRPRP
jgi:methylmalonyl-CoA mutase